MRALNLLFVLVSLGALFASCDDSAVSESPSGPGPKVLTPVELPKQNGADSAFLDTLAWIDEKEVKLAGEPAKDTFWFRIPCRKDSSYSLAISHYWYAETLGIRMVVYEGNQTVPVAEVGSLQGVLTATAELRATADGWFRVGLIRGPDLYLVTRTSVSVRPGDKYDPDGERKMASLLPTDSTTQWRKAWSDTDWVRLETIPGRSYRIEAVVDRMRLEAWTANSISAAIEELTLGNDSVSRASFPARSTNTYVALKHGMNFQGDSSNHYGLRAILLPDDDRVGGRGMSDARLLPVDRIDSGIVAVGDGDWFKVPVKPGSSYDVDVQRRTMVPKESFVAVNILAPNSTVLASMDWGSGSSGSAWGFETITPTTDTIFVQVRLYSGSLGWSDYRLRIQEN